MQNNYHEDQRTNPRTYTEFCKCLERYPNISIKDNNLDNEDLVVDANSLLDKEIIPSFIKFVTRDMELMIEPLDILMNFKKIEPLLKRYSGKDGNIARIDIISVICDRMYAYISSDKYEVKTEHVSNFQSFVKCEYLTIDITQALLTRLARKFQEKRSLMKFLSQDDKLASLIAKNLRLDKGVGN